MCEAVRNTLAFFIVAGSIVTAQPTVAQSYPIKPVHIVVATGPGSPDDTITRLIAPKLSEFLGQQIVVDNRPGSGGLIGQTFVAGAPPDGYTLLFAGGSMTGSRIVNANFKLDVLRDFSPVSQLTKGRFFLVAQPNVAARNVKEFIALARSNPGKLTYVSTGVGQTPYWDALLFNSMAGIKAVEVPYKASAEGLTDLIAGRVDYFFVGSSIAVANKGRLRVLAVSTADRSNELPDVPAIAEELPGYDMPSWSGLVGPGAMRADIIKALNSAVVRTLGVPAVRDGILKVGSEPSPSTPEELARRNADGVEKYSKLARLMGIKPL